MCKLGRISSILSLLIFLVCPSAGVSAQGQTTPDDVARKVANAAGEPYDVQRLSFTFVVEKGQKEVLSRRHIWSPNEGKLEVKSSGETIVLQQIDQYNLTKKADKPAEYADVWRKVSQKRAPKRAAEAWKSFINDSYWLLAPSKVTDPGVERRLDDSGRLVLQFEGVGLTPGDTYWLTVDRQTWRVTDWRFELEGGRTGAFEWLDYQKFGPLMLSTRRVSKNDNVTISFEDVVVEPSE
jgi:hypothetical protein